MAMPESDEETKDTSQFRVVSNPKKSKVDIICNDIIENDDMSRLKDKNFDELSREENMWLHQKVMKRLRTQVNLEW